MAPVAAPCSSTGLVQRFGTGEHGNLGDQGSAGLTTSYKWNTHAEKESGKPSAAGEFRFVLTHGDIVCLSGDYFDPRDVDDQKRPIPDSLFGFSELRHPGYTWDDPTPQLPTESCIVSLDYVRFEDCGHCCPERCKRCVNPT